MPVSRCEADHITEFSHGGTTSAANLQPLCSTHNRLKYRRTRRRTHPGKHTHTGNTTQAKPGTGGKAPPGATGPPGS